VEHRPYVGAIVAELSIEDLEDVYATRSAIEAMLAREVTLRAGPQDRVAIEQLLEGGGAGGNEFVDLDRRFHLGLYELTGFRTALSFLDRLLDRSERYARVYAQHETGLRRSVTEHRQIFEAFAAGDAVEAERLTAEHISWGVSTRSKSEEGHW